LGWRYCRYVGIWRDPVHLVSTPAKRRVTALLLASEKPRSSRFKVSVHLDPVVAAFRYPLRIEIPNSTISLAATGAGHVCALSVHFQCLDYDPQNSPVPVGLPDRSRLNWGTAPEKFDAQP
jgi:hypothetical protein